MKRLFVTFLLLVIFLAISAGNTSAAETKNMASVLVSWPVIHGARSYAVYYGTTEGIYRHAVRVPDKGTSVTIGYLNPNLTYYYRVAALVGTKEVWQDEKVLKQAEPVHPVLGTTVKKPAVTRRVLGQTGNSMMMDKITTTKTACTGTGSSSVAIKIPNGISATKEHILYGIEPGKYLHALRDLSGNAREVMINHLSCRNYYYQVAVVGSDGRVYWQGEKTMTPSSPPDKHLY